jgi:hypothetical protein
MTMQGIWLRVLGIGHSVEGMASSQVDRYTFKQQAVQKKCFWYFRLQFQHLNAFLDRCKTALA